MPTEKDTNIRHCSVCKKQWLFKVFGDICPNCQGIGYIGFLTKAEAPMPSEHKLIGLSNYEERQKREEEASMPTEPNKQCATCVGCKDKDLNLASLCIDNNYRNWVSRFEMKAEAPTVDGIQQICCVYNSNDKLGTICGHPENKLDKPCQYPCLYANSIPTAESVDWHAKYTKLVETNAFMIKHNQEHIFKLNVIITFLKEWHEERDDE